MSNDESTCQGRVLSSLCSPASLGRSVKDVSFSIFLTHSFRALASSGEIPSVEMNRTRFSRLACWDA